MKKPIYKILIADDNVDSVAVTKTVLAGSGEYEIVCAYNGYEVLDKAEQFEPDIILLDVVMPNFDGYAVIESIRDMEITKKPKIIVFSNLMTDDNVLKAMACGADYYIYKNIDMQVLANTVASYCATDDMDIVTVDEPELSPLAAEVSATMHEIGIPAHVKGYKYLRTAIIMAVEHRDIIDAVTKQLYPSVAMAHNSTPSRVERAIRHSIELAWDRGNVDILTRYFGYTISESRGKPTNSEFIAMIADNLILAGKN